MKKDLQSNSANTDTEGTISVRIKRVEIKENLRALGLGTKQTVFDNDVSVLGKVWLYFHFYLVNYIIISLHHLYQYFIKFIVTVDVIQAFRHWFEKKRNTYFKKWLLDMADVLEPVYMEVGDPR